MTRRKGGWYGEPKRHGLAAKGIKTGRTITKPARKRAKTRTTYDVVINGDVILNFDDKRDAEEWLQREPRYKKSATIRPKRSKNYILGEMWRQDFDYEGMLLTGMTATVDKGEKWLSKLFDSYEDVNYHSDSEPLWNAIKHLRKGRKDLAEKDLRSFHNRVTRVLKIVAP